MKLSSQVRAFMDRDASRLGLHYAALFSVIGVQTPFWSVWLTSRAMGPVEIGVLIGAIYWAKVVTNPLIAHVVDSYGHRRTLMILMVLITAALYACYPFADGFWQLLVIGVLGGSLLAGLTPLTETIAMTLTQQGAVDYGRVRLWGSLSFLAFASVTGPLLDLFGPSVVLWLVLVGIAATIYTVFTAPNPPQNSITGPRLSIRALWGNRRYRLFLISAALSQASHCVYYGFSTLDWQAAGMSGKMISLLWGTGVVAEIVLFSISGRVVRWVGATRLVFIAAIAGLVRWTVLAQSVDPWLLFPAQILHAATFGACHLGAMHLIAQTVPPRLQARGQALYSSIAMGLFPGLAILIAGPLFKAFGGGSFYLATALSLGATVFGLWLCRSPTTQA